MDLEHIKTIGIEAARKGATVLKDLAGKTSIRKKGRIDLVTEADLGSEKVIIHTIKNHFPDHDILAEETGRTTHDSEYEWIIDPLDGTTNFAHQIPHYAISIAFAIKGDVVAGIVLNPVKDELFTAVTGSGATLNDNPITVSEVASVSESLLVTGFPYNFKEIFETVTKRFSNCLSASQGIRRFGSAALDLCDIACGRFDGFWEQNLKPWDTAAGFIIATEAGATVTDFSNKHYRPEDMEVLATNGKIHKEMIGLLEVQE